MSDTIKKWHEMNEDKDYAAQVRALEKDRPYIYESPDGGLTVTRRPFGGDISDREVIQKPPIVSEGHKKLAYSILIEYPEESILEAARILNSGK